MPQPTCSIEGCERPVAGRGWCKMHWERWRKHGDPRVVRGAPTGQAWRDARQLPPKPICSIDGCERLAEKRGWCSMHYQRWRRYGSLSDPRPTPMDRFMSKVAIDPVTGCHVWTAGRFDAGYGMFSLKPRTLYAHRWLWEQVRGPVPDGLVLDHIVCDNPACVNLDHLRVCTNAENVMRSLTMPCAVNARKTHCVNGHEFTPENTQRFGPDLKWRRCIPCQQRASREAYARRLHRLLGVNPTS